MCKYTTKSWFSINRCFKLLVILMSRNEKEFIWSTKKLKVFFRWRKNKNIISIPFVYHRFKVDWPIIITFFSIWVFSYRRSRITGLQGKGEGISLTPHFHPLHRHLGITRTTTAESSPLSVASSRTRTGNLWFPSASR